MSPSHQQLSRESSSCTVDTRLQVFSVHGTQVLYTHSSATALGDDDFFSFALIAHINFRLYKLLSSLHPLRVIATILLSPSRPLERGLSQEDPCVSEIAIPQNPLQPSSPR
jgi:hypothetical protein